LSTLNSSAVDRTLAELHAQAEREDPEAKRRVSDSETELGERLGQRRRYELYGDAPLAIAPEVGKLLYALCRARRARRVVEFGCSLGISTIYLAAAIRDEGEGKGGSVVTSELLTEKANAALQNLARAGLEDLVEVRLGDALHTLKRIPAPIDLLFLDGRNDQYRSVLRLVEGALAPEAMVVADLNSDDPDLDAYLEYVRDPRAGYTSVEIPLGDGVEVSIGPTKGALTK